MTTLDEVWSTAQKIAYAIVAVNGVVAAVDLIRIGFEILVEKAKKAERA